jgi:hypothetical protein
VRLYLCHWIPCCQAVDQAKSDPGKIITVQKFVFAASLNFRFPYRQSYSVIDLVPACRADIASGSLFGWYQSQNYLLLQGTRYHFCFYSTDSFGWIKTFRADVYTVHNGMAAE